MAKLKIFTYPDVVLATKANPIARVEKDLFKLADDMLETMYDAPGVGLAANQVGILQRILVVDVDYDIIDENDPDAQKKLSAANGSSIFNKKSHIIINPEIIYKEGTNAIAEGCLSVPEYYAEVKRAEKIKMQYQTIDGVSKVLAVDGYLAIAIQHEIDHLDGKLFIDRLSPLKKEMARKKLRQERLRREEEMRSGVITSHKDKKNKSKGF